eukprot:2175213-Pleurochrysis_carterae.AAC.2
MMKPGEDPFELGRRRDIWLQCHSIKYVSRMLEAEYNEVAEKHVLNTQAGCTEDRMASEHFLAVRIVEERCEWHEEPCLKGYVDMRNFHERKSRGAMGGERSDGGARNDNLDDEGATGGKRKGSGGVDRKI